MMKITKNLAIILAANGSLSHALNSKTRSESDQAAPTGVPNQEAPTEVPNKETKTEVKKITDEQKKIDELEQKLNEKENNEVVVEKVDLEQNLTDDEIKKMLSLEDIKAKIEMLGNESTYNIGLKKKMWERREKLVKKINDLKNEDDEKNENAEEILRERYQTLGQICSNRIEIKELANKKIEKPDGFFASKKKSIMENQKKIEQLQKDNKKHKEVMRLENEIMEKDVKIYEQMESLKKINENLDKNENKKSINDAKRTIKIAKREIKRLQKKKVSALWKTDDQKKGNQKLDEDIQTEEKTIEDQEKKILNLNAEIEDTPDKESFDNANSIIKRLQKERTQKMEEIDQLKKTSIFSFNSKTSRSFSKKELINLLDKYAKKVKSKFSALADDELMQFKMDNEL